MTVWLTRLTGAGRALFARRVVERELDDELRLELVSAIEQEFLLKIDDKNISPQLFRSVNTMARYVCEKLAEIAQITESTNGE